MCLLLNCCGDLVNLSIFLLDSNTFLLWVDRINTVNKMFLWNQMKMVSLNWVLCSNFQRRSFSSCVEADLLSLRLPVQAPPAVPEGMDPLGARSQFVDVQTLPTWPQQLAEGGEAAPPDPSDSQAFPSPFPFRPDINSKIILLWVFTPEMDDSASLVLKSTISFF